MDAHLYVEIKWKPGGHRPGRVPTPKSPLHDTGSGYVPGLFVVVVAVAVVVVAVVVAVAVHSELSPLPVNSSVQRVRVDVPVASTWNGGTQLNNLESQLWGTHQGVTPGMRHNQGAGPVHISKSRSCLRI